MKPHVGTMYWHDLCFMHWAVDPALLRPLIPAGLELDTYDGKAWIALVPFRMSKVCPRGVPHWPWLTDFPEMNVRTYVRDGHHAGVWFFSLDATQPLAVWAARTFFHLAYFNASICCEWHDDWHYYSCQRPGMEFAGRYRPSGPPILTQAGSIEHFLTERYWLFAESPRKKLYRGRIHHVPWPLQSGQVEIQRQSYMNRYGVSGPPDLVHFAREIFVYSWAIEPL